MADFQPNVSATLGAFAAGLGLPFRPARDGSVSFRFERSGTLTFTPADDGERVLMTIAALPARPSEATERMLLDSAGPDAILRRFVHTGLSRDGSHHWGVALDNDEMTEQLVFACLERLIELRRAIA